MNQTTYGSVRITLFGHSSVLLEYNSINFYIDPFVLDPNPKRADVILHTHSHFDHCVVPDSIVGSKTQIISRAGKFAGMDIKIGETIKTNGVLVHAVHAYNKNKPFHPKGEGAGFLLVFPALPNPIRIYVAGDTDLIDEMKSIRCDVAILPIGGKYTMNSDEAAQAVSILKPRIVIPYHYNYMDDLNVNPNDFSNMVHTLYPDALVRILVP